MPRLSWGPKPASGFRYNRHASGTCRSPTDTLAQNMTDDRVREARLVVGNYVEPHLGMPLAEAKAVKSVRLEAGTAVVDVELGFPAGRYAPQLAGELEPAAGGRPGAAPARVEVTWRVAAQAVQGGLKPPAGDPQRHRRGLRQGRRRQVHHGRQPGAGARARRRPRRPARRRHLRPEPAAHDWACRASGRRPGTASASSRSRPTASR